MTYDILRYTRDMSRRYASGDRVPASYCDRPRTAPKERNEVAVATSPDRSLQTLYGYDGDWREEPPAEAIAHKRREEQREATNQYNEEVKKRKAEIEVFGEFWEIERNVQSITVKHVDQNGTVRYLTITLEDLRFAAGQSGPLGTLYKKILNGEKLHGLP